MKFEINDKTGMLTIEQEYILDEDINSELKQRLVFDGELEQILQAVKKTQEKLVNKQIQEIQDSKKDPEYIIHKLDETKKLFRKHKEKIEENQKIVDSLIKEFNDAPLSEGQHYANMLNNFVVKATGKDIKELS